ncbi:MAG: hypothetical protein AAGF48_01695 [Pseudomonadota bacterium]
MKLSATAAIGYGWDTFKKRPVFFIGAMIILAVVTCVVGFALAIGAFLITGPPDLAKALDQSESGSLNPLIGLLDFGVVLRHVLNAIVSVLIAMCTTGFLLAAHDKPETVGLSDLWQPNPFWTFLGGYLIFVGALILMIVLAQVLMAAASTLPLKATIWVSILTSVAAVIGAVLFFPWAFVVMDRKLGPIQSLRESLALTRGNRWRILGFFALCLLTAGVWAGAFLVTIFIGQSVLGYVGGSILGAIVAIAGYLTIGCLLGIASANVYRQLSGGVEPVALDDARLAA